jgi:hypothetical protein
VVLVALTSGACISQGNEEGSGTGAVAPSSITAPVLQLAGTAIVGVPLGHTESLITRNVYPGIDVATSLVGGVSSYTFVVSPEGDPHDIELTFPAAANVRIAAHGALIVRTGDATFRQPKPYVYQTVGSRLIEIRSRYVRRPGGGIGVWLESYGTSLPLVIDPELRLVGGP